MVKMKKASLKGLLNFLFPSGAKECDDMGEENFVDCHIPGYSKRTYDKKTRHLGFKLVSVIILLLFLLAVVVQVFPVNEDINFVWASYMEVLTASPLQTKAITSATVYAIGDVVSQQTKGTKISDINRMRVVRSLIAGLIGHGPLSHVWYNFNELVFNDIMHWTAWWSVFPKVVLDQCTWGPFWNNTYILLIGLMKRDSLATIWSNVKRTTIPLIVSGLKLWPFVHLITYGLIPIENRLLWVDLVEIVWVVILATQAAGASEGKKASD
mmetsp:Transcript_8394/g.13124  ORF Transcript_8394/g.13124 Transcript_8394/m.13124 type:complete len:268 (+) Transcript_8394:120-923(+)